MSTDGLDEPLPEQVRARVVALAADALGALPASDVPPALRVFVRFKADRRARLAGTPIAAAVETDAGFRELVAQRLREGSPDLAAALDQGLYPAAADPFDVAAAAYLLRPTGWTALVERVSALTARRDEDADASARSASVGLLTEQLAAVRAGARAELERHRLETDRLQAENRELRRGLLEAGRRAGAADRAVAQAQADAAQAGAAAEASASTAEVETRRLRARVSDLESEVESARRSSRGERGAADVRLRLLLDTVLEAAQGLRRELALPPVTQRPADGVGGVERAAARGGVAPRALAAEDPALLDQLLALPQAHLVVDGYNVTKTGYGELPLEVQRNRLVGALGALVARTGAEVTVVFDGAALEAAVPLAAPRGVRVLFSPPKETADEVIRRLVRAEPRGRVVVVVSSDREVADGVRASGAHPLPATALLRRLARG